jgi:cysteine-rich repeat protein
MGENNCTLTGAICGNGIIEAGEACDDGNLVNGDGCDNCTLTGAICEMES